MSPLGLFAVVLGYILVFLMLLGFVIAGLSNGGGRR